MRQKTIDFSHGPLAGPILRYSIPLMFTGFLQQFFNAVDVILAGQLLEGGSNMVAAVGSTTALTGLMINFFLGCSAGAAVVVSHAVGSRDTEQIRHSIHTSILFSFLIGALLTVAGIFLSAPLLRLMSTPQSIIRLSTVYLQIYFTGMIPYMVYNFSAAVLYSIGETKSPMYFLFLSGAVKIGLMFLFVSGLDFGITGLALSTALSQLVCAALGILALMHRHDLYRLQLRHLRFHGATVKKVLKLGIPSGIQSTTFSISNVLIQTHTNSLDYLPGFVAGNAAAVSLINFADAVTNAFYRATITFAGQSVGAGNHARVKKIFFTASGLSTAVIAVISTLVILFSNQLLGFYITDSADAIHWGRVRLLFIFAPLFLQGLMDVTLGTLRGMGITVSNTVASLVGICGLRILWCLTVFQQFHTPNVLFLCYSVSWIITWIALLLILRAAFKKHLPSQSLTHP